MEGVIKRNNLKNKMITFEKKEKTIIKIVVKVDGRVSGYIKQVKGGWQYQPAKDDKKFFGLVYPTQIECMNSLF